MKKINTVDLWTEQYENQYECFNGAFVDGFSDDNKFICARSYMDIPNEDGTIFIKNDGNVNPGDFIKCKITAVRNYDMLGELVK